MRALVEVGSIEVLASQRERWLSGRLAPEWKERFPDLFDEDDLRIAMTQPTLHFYEWLGAIVLHHATGYCSLVEKYEFSRHARKQQVVAKLLPQPVHDLLRDRERFGRTQAPDLLMYADDLSDWFFCEVLGPRDTLQEAQSRKFDALAVISGRPVRLLEFVGPA